MNTQQSGQPAHTAPANVSNCFAVGQGALDWSPAPDSAALLECPECEGIGQVLGRACPLCGGSGECSRAVWDLNLEALR